MTQEQTKTPYAALGFVGGLVFLAGLTLGALLTAVLLPKHPAPEPQISREETRTPTAQTPTTSPTEETINFYFSPKGGATEAVVREVRSARFEVLCLAYSFSSPEITQAFINSPSPKVILVADKGQFYQDYSTADEVAKTREVRFDPKHAIAHNKVIIIDDDTIITGSFNFTRNAEQSNAENLLVIKHNKVLVAAYKRDFYSHYQHSTPFSSMQPKTVKKLKERNNP